jgi:hypothetical protein
LGCSCKGLRETCINASATHTHMCMHTIRTTCSSKQECRKPHDHRRGQLEL